MDKLYELWEAGRTATEITEHFPTRSRNAVLGKVYRLRKRGVRLAERGSLLGGKYHWPEKAPLTTAEKGPNVPDTPGFSG